MTKFVASYYKGGHRVMLGAVPCRISRLPQHEGGKALLAQSSREMCLPLPPRGKADRAKWERQQMVAYQAAEKLGNRSIDDVVTISRKAPPTVALTPSQIATPTPIERPVFRAPSRPVTRRPVSAITGAMRTIHYYRVSTAKQGRSGLGLEAQRSAVEAFCATRGCQPLGEYVEIESGRKNDRPELLKALRHARMTGATVIIAKLDRLGRNLAFLATLQESGARFIAADNPDANELTVQLLAAVAQNEAKAISERTKAALEAAKARGQRLGNPLGAKAFGASAARGRELCAVVNRTNAQAFAEEVRPIIDDIRASGHSSIAAIAAELNAREIVTARRGRWSKSMVHSILQRTSAETA